MLMVCCGFVLIVVMSGLSVKVLGRCWLFVIVMVMCWWLVIWLW